MGATMQGKTGIARKEHLSRPTSSFAYLARGEYRFIFVGRSNRRIESKEKLRGRREFVSFGCASRPSANARCAPPINLICYPKAGAWQIVLPACLPANPAIPPVIITSARTASERRWLHPPPSFLEEGPAEKYTSREGKEIRGNAGITYVLSGLLHFFLNKCNSICLSSSIYLI